MSLSHDYKDLCTSSASVGSRQLPMHHCLEGLILDLRSVPWVLGGWEQGLKEGRYKEFKTSKIQYGVYW